MRCNATSSGVTQAADDWAARQHRHTQRQAACDPSPQQLLDIRRRRVRVATPEIVTHQPTSRRLAQQQRGHLGRVSCVQQRLFNVLGVDEREIFLDLLKRPAGGNESEQMGDGEPLAADAWLAVHRPRLDGDSIENDGLPDSPNSIRSSSSDRATGRRTHDIVLRRPAGRVRVGRIVEAHAARLSVLQMADIAVFERISAGERPGACGEQAQLRACIRCGDASGIGKVAVVRSEVPDNRVPERGRIESAQVVARLELHGKDQMLDACRSS